MLLQVPTLQELDICKKILKPDYEIPDTKFFTAYFPYTHTVFIKKSSQNSRLDIWLH